MCRQGKEDGCPEGDPNVPTAEPSRGRPVVRDVAVGSPLSLRMLWRACLGGLGSAEGKKVPKKELEEEKGKHDCLSGGRAVGVDFETPVGTVNTYIPTYLRALRSVELCSKTASGTVVSRHPHSPSGGCELSHVL